MNITKEKAVELGKQIATSTYTNRHYLDRTVYTFNLEALHTLVNAAIEWYIAQQAASVDATFKKWNTPILDKYAPMQHEPENEPAVSLAAGAAPTADCRTCEYGKRGDGIWQCDKCELGDMYKEREKVVLWAAPKEQT